VDRDQIVRLLGEREAAGRAEMLRLEQEAARIAGLIEECRREVERFAITREVLSGLVTEADWQAWTAADIRPYADVVLDAFGPDRVMFGSDWPVCELAASYAAVVGLARELTADEGVFGDTARRWYRLHPVE